MQRSEKFRRSLSLLLALALLCSLLIPAMAAESPETEPSATETTVLTETEETTVPATEETEPEETTIPTTEETEPEETNPEETTVSTEPEETEPEETTAPTEPKKLVSPFSAPYKLYFGLLHSHTEFSDGQGTVQEAYAYADSVEGLDFFAVTDHSNSFDNSDSAAIDQDASAVSGQWAEGIAAAAEATTEDFLAIFGYEMSFPEGMHAGHITTYNTPGFQSWKQEPYFSSADRLEEYYKTLTRVPDSVSQFCHPGTFYGDFEGFGNYSAEYDNMIHLLEVTDEGDVTAYKQYDRALDAGWHVAPTASQNNHNRQWGDANDDRTVVLAEELTQESLFEAIRAHRVYATRDKDLHLFYQLNGKDMGSILPSVEDPEIIISLYDPTDDCLGTVEIITEDGASIFSQTVESNFEVLIIPLTGRYRYYYLRVTQPDGDIAVTAPVWMDDFKDMGITSLTTGTEVPIQGDPLELTLELYNNEPVDLVLEHLELYADNTLVYEEEAPGTVFAREGLTLQIPYTHPDHGVVQLRAVVKGTADGETRKYEQTIAIRFRNDELVSGMLVDGSHGGPGLDVLANAKELARLANTHVTLFTEDLPLGGELLLIPPMTVAPTDAFLQDVAAFLEDGGSLILCGSEGDNIYENQLLEAIGSGLRLSGSVEAASCTDFNRTLSWCKDLTKNQFFRHGGGCAVEPGQGSWLVKTPGGQIVLACEDTGHGGTVFAAGSSFLNDDVMPLSDSVWELPRANQSIFGKILGSSQVVLEQTTIRLARRGTVGTAYRIKGYVTAGNSNAHNTFPNTIYLQDDSGGIAVTGFTATGIQVGAPVEVIGILKEQNGNPVLEYGTHRELSGKHYRYDPRVMTCETATNYLAHGSELVKIEGVVTARTLTKDKKGISQLTVKDAAGDTATVVIEDYIKSGSTGKNTLASDVKKGSSVRVIGILYMNEKGKEVLRVRNCEEVVTFKAKGKEDKSNPRTGDIFYWLWP